jgi:hypothetical protein
MPSLTLEDSCEAMSVLPATTDTSAAYIAASASFALKYDNSLILTSEID